jgi:putative ABC transport system substrate-binding protein
MIDRRALLIALGAAAVSPRWLFAQTKRPVLIGWLHPGSQESNGSFLAEFKAGLAALGRNKNSQVKIEVRWGNDRNDRLKVLAQELAVLKPAVIVASSLRAIRAVTGAAPSMPIVCATAGDLVAAGFATSLARPGGMVTGLTNLRGNLADKYLEVLLEIAPLPS